MTRALAKRRAQKRRRALLISSAVCIVAGAAIVGGYLYYQTKKPPTATIAANTSAPKQAAPAPSLAEPTQPAVVPQKPVHDATIPPVVNGVAPVISHIETKQPVVFLSIDDGANKQPFELQLLKENNVKATLFLADSFIRSNPGFFTDFTTAGFLIEDHTVDHKNLAAMSLAEQKQEICTMADKLQQYYGRRPILMRPPGGAYNVNTPKAAAACGMKAVVQWIAKANGGSMQYQIGHSLRPGDIVLMHFRPEFKADLTAFLNAQNAAGLHTELLEDWLPS